MATQIALLFAIVATIASCNKAIPDATPIVYPPVNNSTQTIAALINADTSYSFFKAAATKTGLIAKLADTNSVFTVFLPDNNAFRASGIPSLTVLNGYPPTVLGGIVSYAIIPGRQYLSTSIPTAFPNIQLPTAITIGQLPGTPINLQLTTFPSNSATGFYDNNIPVVKPDIEARNGVIQVVAAIVAPPSQVLRDALYSNPDLTYFKAAIARADSGATGLNRFDSLLNYPVTNMTVLAPNDAAFKSLIFGTIYGYLLSVAQSASDTAAAGPTATFLSSTPAVFSNPLLFSALTAATVKGILAYHFLATDSGAGFQPNIRVFSNNFSSTPTFHTTLVNSAVAIHPGILTQATFAGPFVTGLQFTGLGTFPPGGAPYSGGAANAIPSPVTHMVDNQAVNGVYYEIDKVLLPQ